jgi:phage-related baseplate assembly protein
MSSQYKFIDTTTGTLTEKLIAAYEKICGVKVWPASPERLFIAWVEAAILDERVLTNWTGNQNIPSRADGENLDALAELFYTQERPAAKSASCTVRFRITAAQTSVIVIPSGTRVTGKSPKFIWETAEDVSIPAGTLYGDGTVICQTPGTEANGLMPGKIDTPVDLWDYMDGCENITVTDGGTDAATDAEFYELMRQSMEAFSVAGPSGAYKYHAMQVSTELKDVIAVNPKKDDQGTQIDGAGIVEIYALGPDGEPATETMKAAIFEACSADDGRPLTDHVFVKDPVSVEYAIDLTYYLPRTSPNGGAAIVSAVNEAVESYKAWQAGKLGRDINPSQLIGMLMDCGIKRCVVRSPSFAVLSDGLFEDPADWRKPEYAVCTSVTVINGGVEDE